MNEQNHPKNPLEIALWLFMNTFSKKRRSEPLTIMVRKWLTENPDEISSIMAKTKKDASMIDHS